MKRRRFLISCTVILLISLLLRPLSAFADNVQYFAGENRLNFATINSRPISNDRLLYTAFRDIGYNASFSATLLQTGYESANNGDRDGVIASTPDIDQTYTNLRKVPVPLEEISIYAFVREGSGLKISSWSDLAGYKVGINSQRPYLSSRIPSGAAAIEKDDVNQVMDSLVQGEYDVAVISHRSHETLNLKKGIVQAGLIDRLSDYLYLHKDYGYLIPKITESLSNVISDGRGEKILDDIQIPGENQKKTVLHIFSSNMQVTREEQLIASLRKPFENDMSIEWYTVELNSKRFSRDDNKMVYFANILRQDFVSKDLAAIIVSGDDALNFLKNYYYLYFRNVPVLFYGILEDYDTAIQGYEPYFTGMTEELAAYETVSGALELFPGTENLYVVNDYTTEGMYYRAAIERQMEPLSGALNIEYSDYTDCYSMLEHIKGLPDDTLVFVGSYFSDSNGQYYPLYEMKRLLERDCSVPILALHSTNVEYNSIGGKCLNYQEYGDILAHMLGRVLDGENVKDIPAVTDPSTYSRWVFDKTMLDKLGIKEKSLPSGSQVLNKTPSIWESDPRFAFTLVSLLVLGIATAASISFFLLRFRRHKELLANEAKIRAVKERLERIISTAPVAYVLSVGGIIKEINETMKGLIGLDVGDGIRQVYVDPAERDEVLERIAQNGMLKGDVKRYRMSNGEIHRCLLNMADAEYEQKHAIVAWVTDIEESEKQKDQLNTAQQDLQTILDTMPVAVRIVEIESGSLTYANKAALEIFNCGTFEEVAGRSAFEFMPEVQPNGMKTVDMINDMNQSGRSALDLQCFKANGEEFDARITSCVIDYKGRISSLAIIEDLTAEKEYQRMLLNAAEKEKEANLLKSRFLVNMSHEIRTPMNAIIGLTEIELRKSPTNGTKEIYKKINISAKNLLEIINDILDLSKIEADKIELFEDEFELEDVLNSALLVASPRLDGKNVEFLLDASLDLPRFVIGDRTRLWQILKNFLDNSAKYTENGKIVLTAFVNNKRSYGQTVTITFIVKDTGIGIDETQMKKLFMPYEQIHNEAQKRYSGTGLGMAISKQLCEIMGGELQVQSVIGEGTTILLNIPFKRSQNAETEIQAVKAPALAGIDVLAVDDDELSLNIMSSLLEGNKVNCVLAKSGIEAMEVILERRDRGESFDIILLDYMMEGLNGLETARQINLALSKAPKLLMVTAYQKLLLKHELEDNGIDDIIEKPFIPSQFINKLCTTLGYGDSIEKPKEVFMRFKDVKVLLCEDYCLNQEVATGMFAQFGIVADIAEDGKQGVEMLNSGKSFDLIFMDLQMPVMDGYEATRIIRANPKYDNIPIISLTADAMKEIVDKCLEIGMDDHIAKPIEFESLQRVFMKWLPESKRIDGGGMPKPALDHSNEALARFGGKRELYEKALLEFTRLLLGEWADFDSAISDIEETKSYVHKLKGVAGNLSEKEIYRCAVEFESSLRNGEPDAVLYDALISACNAAKTRITGQIPNRAEAPLEAGTAEELAVLLNKLEDALQNYNPRTSSDTVKLLKEKSWPSADGQKLQQLYKLARKYEFDAALDILDSIRMDDR